MQMGKKSINFTCFSFGNNLLPAEWAGVCIECLFDLSRFIEFL